MEWVEKAWQIVKKHIMFQTVATFYSKDISAWNYVSSIFWTGYFHYLFFYVTKYGGKKSAFVSKLNEGENLNKLLQ